MEPNRKAAFQEKVTFMNAVDSRTLPLSQFLEGLDAKVIAPKTRGIKVEYSRHFDRGDFYTTVEI